MEGYTELASAETQRSDHRFHAATIAGLFTGKERDQESGLDYFGARYYGSALGRFTSPDEPLVDQNLYGYVRNNPLRFTDPDGRECTYDPKTNNFTGDCSSPGDEKVTQAGVAQTTTVGAYSGEGLAALAAVGAKLTDPHEWVDLTSHAARGAASVIAPGPSAVAECITPGGNCDKTNLVLAAIPLFGRKLDFVFGLATGSLHNLERYTEMLSQLESIGIFDNAAGRQVVVDNLTATLNNESSIVSRIGDKTVRESLLMGRGVKLQSIWQDNKLITVMVFGGKK